MDTRLLLAIWRNRVRSGSFRRRHQAVGFDRRDRRTPDAPPDRRRPDPEGRCNAPARVRLRHRDPVELRFLARRPLPGGQLLLHRRVEHIPLRPSDRRTAGADQRRNRILSTDACRRRPVHRVPVQRQRIRSRADRGPAAGRRRADHVSRRAARRDSSRAQDVAGRLTRIDPPGVDGRPARSVSPAPVAGRRVAVPGCRRL